LASIGIENACLNLFNANKMNNQTFTSTKIDKNRQKKETCWLQQQRE
jgi:hypothetical protein